MRTLLAVVSFLSLSAACGGDDGGSAPNIDARAVGDSAPVTCTAPDAFGQATVTDTAAQHSGPDTGGNESVEFFGVLNTDATPDSLYISLYNGYAPFDPDIMPTTVQLTGDQADFATCGACVEVDTDLDSDGSLTDIYFANGGTLTLSSTTTNLTGTIASATFVHSTIDDETLETTPVGDGCQTTISSASFTATIMEADDGSGSGSGSGSALARSGNDRHGRKGGVRLKLSLQH